MQFGDMRRLIERVGVVPSGLIALAAFVMRSAETYSFFAFSVTKLPAPWPGVYAAVTGFGIAFACEIMGSAAWGKWRHFAELAYEVQSRRGLTRQQREAQLAKYADKGRLNFWFGALGYCASIAAGLGFAITVSGRVSLGDLLIDLLTMLVATAVVAYVFVFYEPERDDPMQALGGQAFDALRGAVGEIGQRIKAGTHTNADIRAIQKALDDEVGGVLAPLMREDPAAVWYDVPTMARLLGRDSDAGQRYVRRVLREAADAPDMERRPKASGRRGEEYSRRTFLHLFADDLEQLAAAVSQRTSIGHPSAIEGVVKRSEGLSDVHTTDSERTPSVRAAAFGGAPMVRDTSEQAVQSA